MKTERTWKSTSIINGLVKYDAHVKGGKRLLNITAYKFTDLKC